MLWSALLDADHALGRRLNEAGYAASRVRNRNRGHSSASKIDIKPFVFKHLMLGRHVADPDRETDTGIGSRETPPKVLADMDYIAAELASKGWRLRSGGARGADGAFGNGAPIDR